MDSTLNIPAEKKRGTFSLRNKLIIGFSLISAFASFITVGGIYTNLQKGIFEGFQRRVLSFVQVAGLQQNGDDFVKITSPQDPLYEKFRLQNLKIRQSDSDIKDVFTLRKDAHGLYYVVDSSEPNYQNFIAFNDRYVLPSELLVENFDTMDKAIVEPEIRTNKNGSYLSAYAPILTQDGTRVGVIGVDILADSVTQQQRQLFFQSAVVLLIALALGIFFGFVAGNALTGPVITLARGARAFAAGKLDERVEVNTRDEIGDLAQTFNFMAGEIQELIGGLEERVAQRTKEHEQATRLSERRAQQLQTIAEIARSISTEKDLGRLLPLITRIVSDRFGFYHVGIFLLDTTNKYAVLRASNSPGGEEMLRQKHRLEVGQTGIVGNVTASGRPRIALDVGADSVFFDNPNLPETRSEMALPLTSRGSIMGALDVQSTAPNAFTDADVSILSLLADQIAIAIDNARLIEEAQSSLAESQAIFNEYIAESWQKRAGSGILGYHQTLAGGKIITDNAPSELDKTLRDEGRLLEIPIRIRDQAIGVLNIRSVSPEREWSADDINMVQAIVERLALALDNARLFEETATRASRERLVTEITTKIRGTNNPQEMIKTAVDELQRALGVTRVEIVPQKIAPPPDR